VSKNALEGLRSEGSNPRTLVWLLKAWCGDGEIDGLKWLMLPAEGEWPRCWLPMLQMVDGSFLRIEPGAEDGKGAGV